MRENRCSYYEGLLLCSISLSTIGCLIDSPDREKYMGAMPLYSKTRIQKTYTTKPSPATLKLSASLFGLCINLLLHCVTRNTLCISPLRHCRTSGILCVTPSAFCMDDTVPLGSVLSLLGSAWPALAVALALCFCVVLLALSLPLCLVLTAPHC